MLLPCGWSVIEYPDIVIQQPVHNNDIILVLVATGEPDNPPLIRRSQGHVFCGFLDVIPEQTHSTCEDSFIPTWQTDTQLAMGVNVVHILRAEGLHKLEALYSLQELVFITSSVGNSPRGRPAGSRLCYRWLRSRLPMLA
jgi:hypothetical protein